MVNPDEQGGGPERAVAEVLDNGTTTTARPVPPIRYAVSTCPRQALCSSMKLLKFPLLITFSLFALMMGTPNIEESREEARSAQAFMDAQEIKAGTTPLP